MNFLKDVDSKLVIAGLGTLGVFGAFVVAVIVLSILDAMGVNEGFAWALAMIAWIATTAAGIYGAITIYNNHKTSAGDAQPSVTIVREVIGPQQTAREVTTVSPATQAFPETPQSPSAPAPSYRSMLLESGDTVERGIRPSPGNTDPPEEAGQGDRLR